MKYKRILLKLSGESLQGSQKYGLSVEMLQSYAEQIKRVAQTGAQIGIAAWKFYRFADYYKTFYKGTFLEKLAV